MTDETSATLRQQLFDIIGIPKPKVLEEPYKAELLSVDIDYKQFIKHTKKCMLWFKTIALASANSRGHIIRQIDVGVDYPMFENGEWIDRVFLHGYYAY